MGRRWWTLVILILEQIFFSFGAGAQVLDNIQATGVVKSTDFYMQASPTHGAGGISVNQFRADLTFDAWEALTFELCVENRLTASRIPLASLSASYDASPGRRVDLEADLRDGKHFRNTLYIDQLNLTVGNQDSQITLGRQAIGFGRISLISPLDLICPFSPEAVDTSIRPGVDAVRGVHYFGLGGQVGATAVFGEKETSNSYLATFSTHLGGSDLLAMAGTLQDRPMAGLGLTFDIGGLGLNGELAMYRGKQTQSPAGDLHASFAVGAVEAWYRFENGMNLLAEYLYNGAGVGDPQDYPRVAASAFSLEGMNYLTGRHYLVLGPSYELHPLVTLEGTLLWNLGDRSLFIRPLLDISFKENMDVQVYWTFKRGRSPAPCLSSGQHYQTSRSEFGGSADYGGVCLNFYF